MHSQVHFLILQHPPELQQKPLRLLPEQGVSKGEQKNVIHVWLKESSVIIRGTFFTFNIPSYMAPRLPPSQLEMIRHMVLSKSLTTSQVAEAAECSKLSIINISNNIRRFGNVRAPPTRVGRRRSITPPMIQALCDYLLEKPGLYVDEMVIFLWDEFRVQVTNSSLKRALASVG